MSCCCGSDKKVKLIYSCSGAANTGYLADQVFRQLKNEGIASGTCLAAVGADLSGFTISAKEADENIIIDGCPVGCGKKIFDNKGLNYTEYVMTDFNVQKGKTEITQEIIDRVSSEIKERIEDCNG
ncbi:MAG: putative zinc-binding protein [Spirochaetales bacterium]|nr:putative zinc-binding protein [Spirochaetales bacterium]